MNECPAGLCLVSPFAFYFSVVVHVYGLSRLLARRGGSRGVGESPYDAVAGSWCGSVVLGPACTGVICPCPLILFSGVSGAVLLSQVYNSSATAVLSCSMLVFVFDWLGAGRIFFEGGWCVACVQEARPDTVLR